MKTEYWNEYWKGWINEYWEKDIIYLSQIDENNGFLCRGTAAWNLMWGGQKVARKMLCTIVNIKHL